MDYKWMAIGKTSNGLTIKARFTGYEDMVQWNYFNDNEPIGNVQTISYSQLSIFKAMHEGLNKDLFLSENPVIDSVDGFSTLWQNELSSGSKRREQ